MGMLDRYRKTGGFNQLLSLIETCGPTKQEKLLELVRQEDPRWADAVRSKMLDINRIYAWPDETLAEVIGTVQDITLATAMHGAPDTVKARLNALLSHGRKRKVNDLVGASQPSANEIAATHLKIIETVRKMTHDGFLRLDRIDPSLHLDVREEEALIKPPGATSSSKSSSDLAAASSASEFRIEYEDGKGPNPQENLAPADTGAEIGTLRKRVTDLSKEVAVLRHELSVARNKLEQIKKIA